jgi:predicted ATPase
MLIEFKVTNYRSIRAEQTLSMVASNYSDELPQNLISCDHVPGLKGIKLVKVVAIYGANASGKSNIINAFRFFAEFIRDSATKLQPGADTGVQPFKLDPACLTEPSKFEMTAVINGIRILHGIELTNERVMREYLVAYPKSKPQVWFEREWDSGKYQWSKSTTHYKHDAALREKARENVSFVSVAAQFNHEQAKVLYDWYTAHLQVAAAEHSRVPGILTHVMVTDEALRLELLKAVKAADIGAVDLQMRKPGWRDALAWSTQSHLKSSIEKSEQALNFEKKLEAARPEPAEQLRVTLESIAETMAIPELIHQGGGALKVALNYYDEESSGTRRFIDLMAQLTFARAANQLSIFDEIETSLHPLLVKALLEFVSAKTYTTHTAQLFFTTHNPLLLDQTLLRRDQIWFTEKDQEGATRLYPLTDFKPRKDESLIKGYLAGRYGGIPFIPAGLSPES